MNIPIKSHDILWIAAAAVVLYATGVCLLCVNQRRLLYPGSYSGKRYDNSALNFEKLPLTAGDGVGIYAYTRLKKGNTKAIFLFHGNNDTAGRLLENAIANGYDKTGYDLYSIEYRGYDDIKPYKTTEQTLISDVKALLPLLKQYEITVFKAHSLGCFAATSLLKDFVPSAVILEAPFWDIKSIAASHYHFMPGFILNRVLKDPLENHANVTGVRLKKAMVVHSKTDRVILFRFGKRLADFIDADNKKFITLENSTHNGVLDDDAAIITDYLKKL